MRRVKISRLVGAIKNHRLLGKYLFDLRPSPGYSDGTFIGIVEQVVENSFEYYNEYAYLIVPFDHDGIYKFAP